MGSYSKFIIKTTCRNKFNLIPVVLLIGVTLFLLIMNTSTIKTQGYNRILKKQIHSLMYIQKTSMRLKQVRIVKFHTEPESKLSKLDPIISFHSN